MEKGCPACAGHLTFDQVDSYVCDVCGSEWFASEINPKPASKVRETVSHSEVEQFLRCNRAHYYGYGLEIESVTNSDALMRGTYGHRVLEKFHKALMDGKTYGEATMIGMTEFIEIVASEEEGHVLNSASDAINYYMSEWFPKQDFTILACEKDFLVNLKLGYNEAPALSMPFIPDLIVRDGWGVTTVIDSKFTYDFYTPGDLQLFPQLPKYKAALNKLGLPCDRLAYSQFRYRSLKNAEPEEKYKFEVIKSLSDARVANTMSEHVKVAEFIQHLKSLGLESWQDGYAFRTFNKDICRMCQFRELCVAELNNSENVDLIKSTYYKPKERREFNGSGE